MIQKERREALNIKRSITTVVVIIAGFYAATSVGTNPRAREVLNKLADDGRLVLAELSHEFGNDNANNTKDVDSQDNDEIEKLIGFGPDVSLPPFPTEVEVSSSEKTNDKDLPVILPTSIEGGMVISNNTSFELDLGALVSKGTSVRLSTDKPQILIIHTHGSEAYTPDQENSYSPSDNFRTADTRYSVIRVGDELTACLESYGLNVLHDRNIYDTPSYTGSYARSGDAVGKYLKEYPSISVVLDVHRDAIGDGDVVYKTVAEGDGKPCSQVMLLVGTGENGLEHPNWQENLKFALYLQSAVVKKYQSLPRPIALKKERYNQQLSTGSLILEVGSSGNTLSEALNAVRLFADAIGPALKDLKK